MTVDWTDGSRLTVTRNGETLDYSFAPSTAIGPSLKGLLGSADGNAADDLTGRDGKVLSRTDPDFDTKLYSQFGNSWRISQAESLFDYRPGESTATFTNLSIPSATVTVDSIPPTARSTAQAICQAAGVRSEPLLDDCLIDVGMTGDASYAAGSAAVAAAGAWRSFGPARSRRVRSRRSRSAKRSRARSPLRPTRPTTRSPGRPARPSTCRPTTRALGH